MDYLLTIIACIFASLATQFVMSRKCARGTMTVKWDNEQHMWRCKLSVPDYIDYSQKERLVLDIITVDDSRE